MPRRDQPICSITFNQMSIPVYDLEQGKKALDGIFMIGETIREERPVRKRMGRKRIVRKRVAGRRRGRAERTKARRGLVGKLSDQGLNKSQIMKETGASFVTITKDLEALGKGKKTRVKAEIKPKRQVRGRGVRRAAKSRKGIQSQKPAEGPKKEKEQKKEGE